MSVVNDDSLINDYKFIFNTDEGRNVLRHILAQCSMDEPSYDKDGRIENTFYNEGRRSVALMILRLLERDSSALSFDLVGEK